MESLTEQQRSDNFNIKVYALPSESGIVACIAGHYGLDPWFQERGLMTVVSNSGDFGSVSILPHIFFGTAKPFFAHHYATEGVTFDDALAALDRAIARCAATCE